MRKITFTLAILLIFLPLSFAGDTFLVKVVINGDTLLLSNEERVRLIGVDTPEVHSSKKLYRDAMRSKRDIKTIQALGKRAFAFTRKLAQGRRIRLEYDQANAHIKHRDPQGCLLAYVYINEPSSIMLSEVFLVSQYPCHIFPAPP